MIIHNLFGKSRQQNVTSCSLVLFELFVPSSPTKFRTSYEQLVTGLMGLSKLLQAGMDPAW